MNASDCGTELAPYKLVAENEQFSNVILFLCIVNSVAAIASTVGNFSVLVTIWRVSSLHSPAFVLLSGLALSDFSVGLVSQPIFVASNVALFYDNCAVLSILLRVHRYFANQFLLASVFTLFNVDVNCSFFCRNTNTCIYRGVFARHCILLLENISNNPQSSN